MGWLNCPVHNREIAGMLNVVALVSRQKKFEYVCAPDCDERTACPKAGEIGHQDCGKRECGCPKHHGCSHEKED